MHIKNKIRQAVRYGFVVVVAAVMVVPGFGAEIFNDTFEGGGATVSGWFSGGPAPVVSTTVGADGSSQSLKAELRTAGADQQFLKYFDAQSLAVGDSITLQWQVRSGYSAGANVNLVRVGFYNSGGSQITTDVAYSNAVLANYTGYSAFVNDVRSTNANLTVMERNVGNITLITGAAHISTGSGVTPSHTTLGNNVFSPLQTFTMTRTANGWDWAAEMGGLENNLATYPVTATSGSFSDATAVTNFDAVGIWYNTATAVYLDNISVSRSVLVPATIVGWSAVSSNVMKMVLNATDQANQYYLHTTTNLTASWVRTLHSMNGSVPFVKTNLSYSSAEGTNEAIYVEANESQAFFTLSTYAEIPARLPLVLGTMTTLSALSSGQSAVFELSDTNRPGAWCWFQDPRVIVDTSNPAEPILLTGAVTWGAIGSDQRGDIDLYWLELASVTNGGSLQRGRFELDDQLQMDDHASPSFMIRPDGRYLVNWSMHGNDSILRTRISTNPGDPTVWDATINTTPTGAGISYTNPRYLSEANGGAGQIFNGVRSLGFDSNFVLSDDLGLTWSYGGRTLDANDPWPTHPDGGRAYVKYAGDGKSKVHIFATDDHPIVNFNEDRTAPGDLLNSIYYAYIESNKLYRADGVVIDEDLSDEVAATPPEMTLLLKDGTLLGDDAMRRGWMDDIQLDAAGRPVGIIQFRANDDPDDHRYFYVRYDGSTWHVNFLCYAGDNFPGAEQLDYTGLASLDPSNPDVVYISTSSDPVTGAYLISSASGLRQNEIFMGRTSDSGATWTWAPLTQNSMTDNLRPIVPAWTSGKSVVLWMQGSYPVLYEYDTKIVGQIIDL